MKEWPHSVSTSQDDGEEFVDDLGGFSSDDDDEISSVEYNMEDLVGIVGSFDFF